MAFLKGKYVQSSSLDGSKIKLKNGEALKGTKADGSEKEIVKVNGQDKVEFPETPVVSQDPQSDNELARKAYVDAQREAAKAHSDAKDALQDAALATEEQLRIAGDQANGQLISQESLARQAADDALQAIDAALDTRVSALESSTAGQEYVDAKVLEEKQLREAADEALDARLDAIEADPVTKAYVDAGDQGAKDYADQKIADLVNSAPETLDTLKELADAIAAGETASQGLLTLIGQTDDKVDAEVLNRQSADQVLDDKIDQEIADRQAGDSALDTRLDALEALPSPVVNSMAGTQTDKAPSVAAAKTYIDSIGMGQTRYVSVGGSDANQGTLAKPYLTIAAAMASITDASPTKRYVVRVGAGNFVESSVALKANVFIVGESERATRITGALSLASDFTGGSDHRSGLVSCTMISACNFDLAAVTSGAGKIYCDNVLFNSTVTFNAYSAISQGFVNNCLFFGAYTQNGHNQTARNCIWYSTITLNPVATSVPNHAATVGGLEIQGGSFGNVTLNTPNGRGEQKITVKNGISQGTLTINGPNGYAFVSPTFTKAKIVTTDGGRLFRYSDAYTMAYSSTEGAWWGDWTSEINLSPVYPDDVLTALDMLGKGLYYRHWYEKNSVIHADGARAMEADLGLGGNKVVGLAAGTASTDAVNKGQLDSAIAAIPSVDLSNYDTKSEVDAKVDAAKQEIMGGIPSATLDTIAEIAAALESEQSATGSILTTLGQHTTQLSTLESGLAQEVADRQAAFLAAMDFIDRGIGDEATRAISEENRIDDKVDQEVLDRQAGDAALQLEVDALEQALADETATRAGFDQSLGSALNAAYDRLNALEARPQLRYQKQVFAMTAQNIADGYVDCAHLAAPMSMVLYVGGLVHFEEEDYMLSEVAGKTRITFMGDLVVPSTGALLEGDMVRVQYMTAEAAGGGGGGGGGQVPIITNITMEPGNSSPANAFVSFLHEATSYVCEYYSMGVWNQQSAGAVYFEPYAVAITRLPFAATFRVTLSNTHGSSTPVEFEVAEQIDVYTPDIGGGLVASQDQTMASARISAASPGSLYPESSTVTVTRMYDMVDVVSGASLVPFEGGSDFLVLIPRPESNFAEALTLMRITVSNNGGSDETYVDVERQSAGGVLAISSVTLESGTDLIVSYTGPAQTYSVEYFSKSGWYNVSSGSMNGSNPKIVPIENLPTNASQTAVRITVFSETAASAPYGFYLLPVSGGGAEILFD